MKIKSSFLLLIVFVLCSLAISCGGGGGPDLGVTNPICGDGTLHATTEECDDGNTVNGDGCSSLCKNENSNPGTSTPVCGDGALGSAELCDDGNTNDNDGCSSTCTLEAGYACSGSPSTCTPVCGNGILTGSETCDDGDTAAGDGCSSTCSQEIGYLCSGAPSVCIKSGSQVWIHQLGETSGTGTQRVMDVATDSNGDIYVTGSFQGTVDFGNGTLVSSNANSEDLFVAKYNAAGAYQWAYAFGDSQSQIGMQIAIDSPALYVMGKFSGSITSGNKTITSSGGDVFFLKFETNGKPASFKKFTVSALGQAYPSDLAVDSSGNVIAIGYFAGTSINCGDGTQSFPVISIRSFVTQMGTSQWTKVFGVDQMNIIRGVAIDPVSNDLFLAGSFQGHTNFGAGSTPSSDLGLNFDTYLLKLNSSGTYQSVKTFGSTAKTNFVEAFAINLDSNQNILLSGNLIGSTDFGGGTLTSTGTVEDIFVAKLDASGNHLWSKLYGDGSAQKVSAQALTSTGDLLLTGSFTGNLDFGNGALASAGGNDIFVAKLASDGKTTWSIRAGGTGDQISRSIAVDSTNHSIVVGEFDGILGFGGGDLTAIGMDGFFVKLNP